MNINASMNFNGSSFVNRIVEMVKVNPSLKRTLETLAQSELRKRVEVTGDKAHEFSSAQSLTDSEFNRDSMP